MWECDFKRTLKEQPQLKTLYDTMALPSEPLNYRNPFLKGGRTENYAFV